MDTKLNVCFRAKPPPVIGLLGALQNCSDGQKLSKNLQTFRLTITIFPLSWVKMF